MKISSAKEITGEAADLVRPPWPIRCLRWLGHLKLPGAHRLVWMLEARISNECPFEVPFFGVRYRGKLDDWIDKNIYYLGAYSPEELDFLEFAARVLGRNRGSVNFFDIGANVGQHSLYMHSRAANVLAFEPSQTARAQFEDNIRLNGISNIAIYSVAFGDRDGVGVLGSGVAGNRGSRSLLWSRVGAREEQAIVRNGDDFLDQVNAPRMDLLKLDVEGFEKRVLCGLADRLRRDRPVVLMELMGETAKGGFANETELRSAFYPDFEIFSLYGRNRAKLRPFDWRSGEIAVVPAELANEFKLMRLA